jgi:hypothetical protein
MSQFSRETGRYVTCVAFLALACFAFVGVKAAEFAERRGWVKREVPSEPK